MACTPFLLLSLLVVGVTSSAIEKRLVSAKTCQDNERLNHVRVVYTSHDQTTVTCAGTLIHERWVITSAQCYGAEGSLKVELGTHPNKAVKTQLLIKRDSITKYPSEESIMLLKLPQITKITPAKLPPMTCITPSEGDELRISGRGAIKPEGGAAVKDLMCLDVKIRHKEHCPSLAGTPFEKNKNIFCGESTDESPIKSCPGDAGSGLLKTENTETGGIFGFFKSEERSDMLYGVLISGHGGCDDKIVFVDVCAKPIRKWLDGIVK